MANKLMVWTRTRILHSRDTLYFSNNSAYKYSWPYSTLMFLPTLILETLPQNLTRVIYQVLL